MEEAGDLPSFPTEISFKGSRMLERSRKLRILDNKTIYPLLKTFIRLSYGVSPPLHPPSFRKKLRLDWQLIIPNPTFQLRQAPPRLMPKAEMLQRGISPATHDHWQNWWRGDATGSSKGTGMMILPTHYLPTWSYYSLVHIRIDSRLRKGHFFCLGAFLADFLSRD